MGLQQDVSPYGSQTVMGPGWPNVDEDALAASAAQYEALAAKLTGSVVPLQQSQLASLSEKWTGGEQSRRPVRRRPSSADTRRTPPKPRRSR